MNKNEDNIVKIAKALSDKTRLKILSEIVSRKNITCGEAEKIAGLSQPTVSHHLKILSEAGLLNTVKDGRFLVITVNKNTLDEFSSFISINLLK
ncbi:MAG TPA: helix-turn-helix domain-containing protein [Ignavibacteriaceae bacterium]|nr:helix-turn-helix domain-containing protein [Ignavibacteriaceae bacterium]